MKRIFPLFLIGCTIIFGVFTLKNQQCKGVQCLQFTNNDTFKEQEIYENTNKSYRALLTDGNIQMRVEIYSKTSLNEAENFTKIKKMKMQGLFENARSPYPGMLSNEIECGKKFLPQFKELIVDGLKMQYMRGYLNERLQYGNCLDSEVKYIGHTALFYCQNQQKWYQFEMIVSPDEKTDDSSMNLFKSIRCAR